MHLLKGPNWAFFLPKSIVFEIEWTIWFYIHENEHMGEANGNWTVDGGFGGGELFS